MNHARRLTDHNCDDLPTRRVLFWMVKHIKQVQWVVGFVTFLWLYGLITVAWDSLVFDSPFSTNSEVATTSTAPDGMHYMNYTRNLVVRERTLARVSRYVMHSPSGKTIELGMSEQFYEPGVKSVRRRFDMGYEIEAGEWCLTATMTYRPKFSLVDHHFVAGAACAYAN